MDENTSEPNRKVIQSQDTHEACNTSNILLSTNISVETLDKLTENKLKGDLIGSTTYSESFVIKTLLRFKKFEWNEDFENDLCFLWDMTIEEDVCKYLFKLSFPSMVCEIISKEIENRLVEILIGILANICIPKELPPIKLIEIETVLSNLDTGDSLILIQIVRFLKVICHKTKSKFYFINQDVIEKIIFILNNSINLELLNITLDLVRKMTSDDKLESKFVSKDLLLAATQAFNTICESEINFESNIYNLDVVKPNVTIWAQIVINFSVYVNEYPGLDISGDIICKEFEMFFRAYSKDDDLEFCIDELFFPMEALDYSASILGIKSDELLTILTDIKIRMEDKDVPSDFKNNLEGVLAFLAS